MQGSVPFIPTMRPALSRLAVAAAFLVAGCAGDPGDPVWGAHATLSPGWGRIGAAVVEAAGDPFTWAPAAAALALQIGGADDNVADWANRETPLFGSRGNAADASEWLRAAAVGTYVAAGLMAPPGAGGVDVKARGFTVGAGALAATWGVTEGLKQAAGRGRPLGQDDRSFPSGHASLASAAARMSIETLSVYNRSRTARLATDTALAGLALTTGWARVEAGEHYPADILGGAAIGNFLAVFATRAFFDPEWDKGVALGVEPAWDGWTLNARLTF